MEQKYEIKEVIVPDQIAVETGWISKPGRLVFVCLTN